MLKLLRRSRFARCLAIAFVLAAAFICYRLVTLRIAFDAEQELMSHGIRVENFVHPDAEESTPVFVDSLAFWRFQSVTLISHDAVFDADDIKPCNSLVGLVSIELWDSGLTDSDLGGLRNTRQLATLMLANAPLHDQSAAQIATMTSLVELDLEGTDITDEGLHALCSLPKLEWLNLSNTRVTDRGLAYLPRLKKLARLNLIGVAITDEGLREIAKVVSITELRLDQTAITDAGVHELASLTKLDSLSVTGTRLTERSVPALLALRCAINASETSISPESVATLAYYRTKARAGK